LAVRKAEIFSGSRITCYPSLEDDVTRDAYFVHDPSSNTIRDGKLITSRGPSTAIDFALTIVDALMGKDVRDKVSAQILLK
jgi:putative intracellular protease/amidase